MREAIRLDGKYYIGLGCEQMTIIYRSKPSRCMVMIVCLIDVHEESILFAITSPLEDSMTY